MNRYSRTAAVAGAVVVGVPAFPGVPAAARDGGPWGAATIAPGREGIVEVAGVPEAAEGVRLTLTAPRGTRVTGTPLDASGYRGSVAADGRSATYTVTGGESVQDSVLPFVLAVPAHAVPGTRLRDCSLRLTDAQGVPRAVGRCSVTVGPGLAGPGPPAVRCAAGRGGGDLRHCPSGSPGHRPRQGRPGGPRDHRRPRQHLELHHRHRPPGGRRPASAVAALNGVSAMSEQIDIVVAAEAGAGRQ
ncbi:carboxypeptidase regulatory-like domain-containing protein [Streptomyces sp. NPDC006265]|uniref:carboxypeptidase regulatory-like domain-containing protein n=1 Tax=Streptomyces sp. NPDC006265 TaxID=3156740 RepID=UPI0033A3C432